MKYVKDYDLLFVLVLGLIVVGLIVGIWLGLSLWTDRNLDFWATWFKGQPVDVPFWVSGVASLVLNGVIVGLDMLGEICRWFV